MKRIPSILRLHMHTLSCTILTHLSLSNIYTIFVYVIYIMEYQDHLHDVFMMSQYVRLYFLLCGTLFSLSYKMKYLDPTCGVDYFKNHKQHN